ncbi:MAG: TrmB family transcriptional regulator [Candidatus Aenigmarchaeota archaeon]|nr:TrmB family transcriptional regulator [Candidatus Aenigmarchaeota archaeon]
MLKQELISDLRIFGLSEYEARAFLALSIHGPLSASILSQKSRIPQSKIYNVMRKLVNKSLAEGQSSKPQRFRAVKTELAFRKMIDARKSEIEKLNKKTSMIVSQLKPFQKKKENLGMWTGRGRQAFLDKAADMVLRSKKEGMATTSRFSRNSLLDSAYSKALKRGIKIRIIGTSELDESKIARAKWYKKQGAKIRILPMDVHPRIGIVDKKEMCMRIDNPLESDFFWSNSPAMINVFRTYFNELWNKAKKF